jgi:hypothetical protein
MWPRVDPVPSGRGRLRRFGPPRPGTDRPAGHGKADASLDQTTSCLQSQIGPVRHLQWLGTAQVETVVELSVTVHWRPVGTAVNGTLVARPAGMTLAQGRTVGSNLTAG